MAFEIFRPVSSPGWPLFDVRQDYRTSGSGSCEVSIEMVHVDEDTVDNPRHRRPLAGLLAHFASACVGHNAAMQRSVVMDVEAVPIQVFHRELP